jgi:hypothetical protein
VVRDASPGRRSFSLLHEFGHHLCTRLGAVADAFWDLPDGGRQLEEDLADAFAAAVLLSERIVDSVFTDGVTAADLVRLWHATSASREACCVAAARLLPAPGYVMLLHPDGRCQFAARNGDAFPIARDTVQIAIKLSRALAGGAARGVDRPTLPGGVQTGQMYFDAVTEGRYTFAVWVTDSPAWESWPVPLDSGPTGNTGWCASCDLQFTSYQAACGDCGEPRCTRCGRCECEPGGSRPAGGRRCDTCFLVQPPHLFTGASTTCNEH